VQELNGVQIKSGSSMERVVNAAKKLHLDIELRTMDQSTRTAQQAANACGCDVAQIVKSLAFENLDNGAITLLLVSGKHNADLPFIEQTQQLRLGRCDGRRVRNETGFAIGGVAPIGHLIDVPIYMDETLLNYEHVWAAAGRPDSVFKVRAADLAKSINALMVKVTE